VNSVADIASADRIIFPGVGACGQAMQALQTLGYTDALRDFILEGRPFLGICLGLQLLFEGSEENGGTEGLGIIPGRVTRFEPTAELPVPQIGWNQLSARCHSQAPSRKGRSLVVTQRHRKSHRLDATRECASMQCVRFRLHEDVAV